MNNKKITIFSIALNVVLSGLLIANIAGGGTDTGEVAGISSSLVSSTTVGDIGEDVGQGPTVYVTPSGKRYHKQYCPTIEGRDVSAISLSQAQKQGRTPCKRCKSSGL